MRQKTYTGHGIQSLMDTCKKHGLTRFNSKMVVSNPNDLDSKWIITRY